MILVTGGAGFIGSNLHASLFARGAETVVVDRLGASGQWRNLAAHPPAAIVLPEELDHFLSQRPPIGFVYHLGAISETTAADGDLTWATNVGLPSGLWQYCADHAIPFVYASSAATYGDGTAGFDDDATPDYLTRLRPLNLYGWTKHAFDLRVARAVASGQRTPPRWAGLKFFNVYGPNEYHKGRMISVVKVKYDEIVAGEAPSLYRSDRAGVADGEQRRDFVWVGDVVDVLLWLLDADNAPSGLYNVGSGTARTYLDLAHAVCDAVGVARSVRFIDMPPVLVGRYQSFTEAPLTRLRAAGYSGQMTPLEVGITRYVRDYLAQPDPHR